MLPTSTIQTEQYSLR